jgi:hypothetical protein
MKPILRCFFISICIILLPSLYLYSQEYDSSDDCCDEYYLEDSTVGMDYDEWSRQISEELNKANRLLAEINLLNREIDSLRDISFAKDKGITEAENELYYSVGSNKKGIDDFRIKFKECEKMIMDCKDAESAERIRKSCFNDIEASRIKCLPEFWERYLMMKKRLEECSGNYTVIKGDCLWKISAKREIYGNGRLWPKIWEANKNGVISAPSRIPKTIKNPNLIYPGQVLRIPVLSETEKIMESNKEKEIKKKRKKKNE